VTVEEYRSLLEEALEAWQDARQGLIVEVRNLNSRRFDFRPAPAARSVEELVVHILEVAMMMTVELTRSDTDFHRQPWPKLLELHAREAHEARGKKELLRLLCSQHRDAERRFLAAGELHMLQLIVRFDGKGGTRLAWLQHGIAHEMYHTAASSPSTRGSSASSPP
jgi:uncharacterized damage-inducible protein DinB